MPLFGRQHVRLPLMNWNQVVQTAGGAVGADDAGHRLSALRGIAAGGDPGDQHAVHRIVTSICGWRIL